jgi:pimeloyl-ACP methyl ester carboxylesterase
MTPFILVHGAWHGAWCWERVVPLLAVRGFTARAIDLPGHGDDPTPPGRVSWEDYLERMGEALAAVAGPAILVGHSLGGGVITGAADRWPEKIRALVYLCALLPDAPDAASRFRATRAITSGVRTAPDGSAFEVDRESCWPGRLLSCACPR